MPFHILFLYHEYLYPGSKGRFSERSTVPQKCIVVQRDWELSPMVKGSPARRWCGMHTRDVQWNSYSQETLTTRSNLKMEMLVHLFFDCFISCFSFIKWNKSHVEWPTSSMQESSKRFGIFNIKVCPPSTWVAKQCIFHNIILQNTQIKNLPWKPGSHHDLLFC